MTYYLATSSRRLQGRELEDYLTAKLGGRIGRDRPVSPRTIHRWMDYVRRLDDKENTFDYYPQVHLPSFGLAKYEAMFRGPTDLGILDVIPHVYWTSLVRDRDLHEHLTAHFLVPPEHFKSLKGLLDLIVEKGLAEGVEVYRLRTPLFIPSPFHEMIDEDGNLNIDGNVDNSGYVNGLAMKDDTVKMLDRIRTDPILVPLIFEADKESLSYEDIWNGIARKLGGRLSDYFRGYRHEVPDGPGKGGRFAQRMFGIINEDFDLFYDSMRVYYRPIYEIPNVHLLNLCLEFDEERPRNMLEVTTRISERCVFVTSYFSEGADGSKQVRMNMMTTFEQILTVLKWLKESGIGFDYYFIDRPKSWGLWDRSYSKFAYWSLFDPRSATWKFETERYVGRLDKIAEK